MGTWSAYEPGIWAPTMLSMRDVAQNVVMYVPFGVLGVLTLSAPQHEWIRLTMRIVVMAIVFSAANEALQLYTVDRVASLTDIASAAIGAGAGAIVTSVGRPR